MSYDKWVEIGISNGYVVEKDLQDGLRTFFATGRATEMALKEWQQNHLIDLEVVLNETIDKWEKRMVSSEGLLDNFYTLFDALQVNKILTENIDSYPELVAEFIDKTKEAGIENAKLNNTLYQVKVNTQGNESDIVLLMTLMLNINRPQSIDSVPKMSSEDFNTLLCLPSLFKRLSKNIEILDNVDIWEERNKQIASEAKAIQKISQILLDGFNPDEVLQGLTTAPTSDNPYYKRLEEIAEKHNISPERVLSKKPKITVKFNGDIEELSKKILDNEFSDYENYKKFVSGDKELISNFWLKEPLKNAISIEMVIN